MRDVFTLWKERLFGAESDKSVVCGCDRPLFRNDDVCWDTPFEEFRSFCKIFWKFGFRQLHGVTLYGKTMIVKQQFKGCGPYEGYPDLCDLHNETIRELSAPYSIAKRSDLLMFLASSPDEIALHGLYHTDYEKMSLEEQRSDIQEGLRQLRELFPGKTIRYFIAPFNRTNDYTFQVCRELGVELLSADGVHLEAELSRLRLHPGVWYRYHHHRFYQESNFSYYTLSMKRLDEAFQRAARK